MQVMKLMKKRDPEPKTTRIKWVAKKSDLKIIYLSKPILEKEGKSDFHKACRSKSKYVGAYFNYFNSIYDEEQVNFMLGRLQYFAYFQSVSFGKWCAADMIFQILENLVEHNKNLHQLNIKKINLQNMDTEEIIELIYLLKENFKVENIKIKKFILNIPFDDFNSLSDLKFILSLHSNAENTSFPVEAIPRVRKLENIFSPQNIHSFNFSHLQDLNVSTFLFLSELRYLRQLKSVSGLWKYGEEGESKAFEYSFSRFINVSSLLEEIFLQVYLREDHLLFNNILKSIITSGMSNVGISKKNVQLILVSNKMFWKLFMTFKKKMSEFQKKKIYCSPELMKSFNMFEFVNITRRD
eukprot:snap_masked-scaffold_6-processed-gene-10.8-mRNA-1 protein AED:1.00 eAED:1.00 QI:0/0/0/0/1/1/2/0/352